MRFDRLSARAFGPFKERIDVDFAALAGPLVAVTGVNGSGKSTMLELLEAAVHRECPTRGSLASLATARDAMLEVAVVNGASHVLRHTVDSVSGKGEALVLDANGAAVLADTKVRSFDEWSAAHLPPASVTLASTFAAQGSGGFLAMKAGERKAVLLRVLGIDELEERAAAARERARTAKAALDVAVARERDERARARDVGAAEQSLVLAEGTAEDVVRALAAAVAASDDAAAALAAFRDAERAVQAAAQRRADVAGMLYAAEARAKDLRARAANNEAVLADGAEIRAAVTAIEALAAQDAATVEAKATALRAVDAARAERDRAHQDGLRARERRQAAALRHRRAEERAAGRADAEGAESSLDGLRADVARAEAELALAQAEVERLQDLALKGGAQRIEALRGALDEVAAGCDDVYIARAALDADDNAAQALALAPTHLDAARRRRENANHTSVAAITRLRAAETRAARMPDCRAAELDAAAALHDEQQAAHEVDVANAAWEATGARVEALIRSMRPHEEALAANAAERARLAPLASKAERLAQAEARLAELRPAIASADAEVARLVTELESVTVPALPAFDHDAAPRASAQCAAARASAMTANVAVATAKRDLEEAWASAARLVELGAERARVEEELADWERLALDLGRDGLQGVLIDAAFPELTLLVNDLLHTCHGPRFTVSINATKTSSDGKRQLEGCEVSVLDTAEGRGREGAGETFSGGERAILSEAISLALSMLACRRAGVVGPTLVRDETGAALDPENGRAYVAMLRRAAEVTGASRVLFVSHDAAMQELADSRIEVRDGRVFTS